MKFDEWAITGMTREPLVYGPKCLGPTIHTWRLSIEETQPTLVSGCAECEQTVIEVFDGLLEMGSIEGRLTFHHDMTGYETPESHWWWEFVPNTLKEDR